VPWIAALRGGMNAHAPIGRGTDSKLLLQVGCRPAGVLESHSEAMLGRAAAIVSEREPAILNRGETCAARWLLGSPFCWRSRHYLLRHPGHPAARQFHKANEPIHEWMSVPFIAHTHHVPPPCCFKPLAFNRGSRRTGALCATSRATSTARD